LVQFGPSKGRIYVNDVYIPSIPPEYFAITGTEDVNGGVDDDEEGVAIRYMIATIDQAFPDPNQLESRIQISANIIGAQDATVEDVVIFTIQ